MKRFGRRRGLRGLVLIGAIVGLVTVGFATQASATPPAAPSVMGTGVNQTSTNKSVDATLTQTAAVGDVVVVSVATGTFLGTVGCTDNTTGPANIYNVVADKNTGSGRLFVCVSKLVHALALTDTVTGTYPQFSGLSVIRVIKFTNTTTGAVNPNEVSTGSGSNPAVSSGKICVTGAHWLFGVVANGNISNFAVDNPPWIPLGSNSGGSGAGKRTLTTAYQHVFGPCPLSQYELTGNLQNPGSGFWQAAIVGLPNI